MKPIEILKEVREILDKDDILISDVGRHKMEIARNYEALEPGTVLISNGFCSMGGAIPGAIGAYLANPGVKILAIVGDGGFQMSMSEFETAVRVKADITVEVWVDGGFGLIKQKQDKQFGCHTDLDFGNPDYELLAKSFGWFYSKDLKQAFNHTGPSLVVREVDYE